MRAFLAVPVRPPADRPVRDLIEGMRRRVAGVRWVDTTTTHITLHFFAELPADSIPAVVAAVSSAAAGHRPFSLHLGELGSFPPTTPTEAGRRARPPHVLWLGLGEASPALNTLAADVQAGVAACGFELDRRPFRAHVTLGRPAPRFDAGAWRAELEAAPEFPVFIADRVVLFESRDGHHVREVMALGAGAKAAPR